MRYPWSHAAGRSRATGAGMRIYRDLVLWEAAHCRFLGQYSGKAVLASVRRTTRLPAPRALPGKPRRHYPGRRDAPGIFHKTEHDASRRPKAAGPACPRHDSSAFRRGDGGKQPSFLLHCIPDLFIGEPQARANSDRPAVSAGRCADRPPLASSSWP